MVSRGFILRTAIVWHCELLVNWNFYLTNFASVLQTNCCFSSENCKSSPLFTLACDAMRWCWCNVRRGCCALQHISLFAYSAIQLRWYVNKINSFLSRAFSHKWTSNAADRNGYDPRGPNVKSMNESIWWFYAICNDNLPHIRHSSRQ